MNAGTKLVKWYQWLLKSFTGKDYTEEDVQRMLKKNYGEGGQESEDVIQMQTPKLKDKNGNIIEVKTPKPEIFEDSIF